MFFLTQQLGVWPRCPSLKERHQEHGPMISKIGLPHHSFLERLRRQAATVNQQAVRVWNPPPGSDRVCSRCRRETG